KVFYFLPAMPLFAADIPSFLFGAYRNICSFRLLDGCFLSSDRQSYLLSRPFLPWLMRHVSTNILSYLTIFFLNPYFSPVFICLLLQFFYFFANILLSLFICAPRWE